MKILLCLILLFAVGGCISSKSNLAAGDNSKRRLAKLSDISGIYSNHGVDADQRKQLSMFEILSMHSSPDLGACDSVEISILDGGKIHLRGIKQGEYSTTVLQYFRQDKDYTFRDSTVKFTPRISHAEEQVPVGNKWKDTYAQSLWLNDAGDLIVQDTYSRIGLGFGVIPAAQSQESIYRYKKLKPANLK